MPAQGGSRSQLAGDNATALRLRVQVSIRPGKVRNNYARDHEQHRLLSERTAQILTMALLAAGDGAGLLYAAHRPAVMIVLSAVGLFGGALKLLNDFIG